VVGAGVDAEQPNNILIKSKLDTINQKYFGMLLIGDIWPFLWEFNKPCSGIRGRSCRLDVVLFILSGSYPFCHMLQLNFQMRPPDLKCSESIFGMNQTQAIESLILTKQYLNSIT
jgi:hypothetical protein